MVEYLADPLSARVVAVQVGLASSVAHEQVEISVTIVIAPGERPARRVVSPYSRSERNLAEVPRLIRAVIKTAGARVWDQIGILVEECRIGPCEAEIEISIVVKVQ